MSTGSILVEDCGFFLAKEVKLEPLFLECESPFNQRP